MQSYLFAIVVVSALVLSTSAIQWKDCGSTDATIKSLVVSGCDTTPICMLPRGKNATVTVNFDTKTGFSKATAVVHGIVAGVPVPFKIPQSDGCKNCGLTCPIKAGATSSYHTNIYISPDYPKIKVIVKWELKDQDSNDIFCFEVPAEVSD